MMPVLFSIEPWDAVWRRNQQLASRVPGTVFVEPPVAGAHSRHRVEGATVVVSPVKPLPLRWPGGRSLQAGLTVRSLRPRSGRDGMLWVTHPDHLEVVRRWKLPAVYDRTDDWPAMESVAASATEVRRREAELFRLVRRVVIVSERMRDQVPQGLPVDIIPNGVDTGRFRPVTPRSTGSNVRIGFAGTLDPFRVDYPMLTALASLPGVEIVAAGPGELPAGVRGVGVLDHREVPEFLNSCDALVAPYLRAEANRTADGLKLYEYFATGLPVIATMTAGFERHPELVVSWPAADLRASIAAQRTRSAERVAIAAGADWSIRARAMADVLAAAAD